MDVTLAPSALADAIAKVSPGDLVRAEFYSISPKHADVTHTVTGRVRGGHVGMHRLIYVGNDALTMHDGLPNPYLAGVLQHIKQERLYENRGGLVAPRPWDVVTDKNGTSWHYNGQWWEARGQKAIDTRGLLAQHGPLTLVGEATTK